MTRNVYAGLALIILSFFVYVPLVGLVGAALSAVLSVVVFSAGVALIANRNTPWRELRPHFRRSE